MTNEIDLLFGMLDGSGSDASWEAKNKLVEKLGDNFPNEALRRYKLTKSWARRTALIYHSIPYAKTSSSAVELGLLAACDKSKVARYRALMLVALTQDQSTLERLERLVPKIPPSSKEDLLAAIDAIKNKNQHYFIDHSHTGKTFLRM
jgi:hypothetical protein